MKEVAWGVLAVSIVAGIVGLTMDTSVAIGSGDVRVNNLGLMQQQQNTIMLAMFGIAVSLFMLFMASKKNSAGEAPTTSSNSAQTSVNGQFYSNVRDIAEGSYKLYLVNKFKIEKNETLGQFVVVDQLFNTLDEALRFADEKDIAAEAIQKERQAIRTGTIGRLGLRYVVNHDDSVTVNAGGSFSKIYQNLDAAIEAEGPVN